MAEKLVCPICGAPTRVYMGNARKDRLCGKHADELKAGKLVLNENGKYIQKEKQGTKKEEKPAEQQKEKPKIKKIENKDECIICANKSDKFLFCKECFKEYANKAILIKINNCETVELIQVLDDHEDGKIYTCKDGHIVRSKSEVLIDNWLYDNGYHHAYEKALPIDDNKEHNLHPDFYLKDLDIYIEHWGYENAKDYTKKKDYKIQKYKELGVTVIGTNEADTSDIDEALTRKLKHYKKGQVNE